MSLMICNLFCQKKKKERKKGNLYKIERVKSFSSAGREKNTLSHFSLLRPFDNLDVCDLFFIFLIF